MALIERRYSPARGREMTTYEALAEKFAMSRMGYWYLLRLAPRLDRFLIPRTNGKWSSTGKGMVGLLTCTGAKSGEERTLPLTAMRREDHWLLAGSNYGREKAPPWVHNLRANPTCEWEHSRGRQPMVATELTGDERDEAFDWIKDFYAGYARYEQMASHRTIAVFRLDPA
ncbi:MAG: nitroreductase/quinone reductase family protein [Nitriliruptorales bacterium]|nr:nitroreductase/quinone reductase family protein [Nitriliruptorales bacterium]